jgi:hypothetical protein
MANPIVKYAGCHAKRDIKTGLWLLKVGISVYPDETANPKSYAIHYVRKPDLVHNTYPGLVDDKGRPTDEDDYRAWIEMLLHDDATSYMERNPFFTHFFRVKPNTTLSQLEQEIQQILDPDTLTSADTFLSERRTKKLEREGFSAFRKMMQPSTKRGSGLWLPADSGIDGLLKAAHNKFKGLGGELDGNGKIKDIKPGTITVGAAATDRGSYISINNVTIAGKDNPANANGAISSNEIWLYSKTGVIDVWVGSFYGDGTPLTCRDSESVGDVAIGSKQTQSGLDVNIETDDLWGVCSKSSVASIEYDLLSGGGIWYYAGECIDASDNQNFTSYTPRALSLYGEGAESGVNVSVDVPLGAASAAGYAPAFIRDTKPAIPLATATGAGYAPAMVLDKIFDVPLATADGACYVPVIGTGAKIDIPLATATAEGLGGYHEVLLQPSDKDALIWEYYPDSTYGDGETLTIIDRDGYIERSILEFDLSSMPYGATIISAVLYIYYYGNNGWSPEGETVYAYKLTRTDWVEAQATWNSYKTGSAWTTPGSDYVTSNPSGGSAVMPGAFGWVSFNVLAIVNDAITNSNPAEFLCKYETESGDRREAYFHSNGYTTDTSKCPKLVITYTIATPSFILDMIPDIPIATAQAVGYTPALALDKVLGIPLATANAICYEPVIGEGVGIDVPLATAEGICYAPGFIIDVKPDIPLATATAVGYEPSVGIGVIVEIPLATAEAAAFTPTLILDAILTIPLAAAEAAGYTPEIGIWKTILLTLKERSTTLTLHPRSLSLTLKPRSLTLHLPKRGEE